MTYETNGRSRNDPTELPPGDGVVSNHVANSFIESVDAKSPRESNAFKEDDPEENQTTDSIRIEQLENVHATLSK